MKRAYLSLGSNIGDRAGHLRAALRHLESYKLRIVRLSPVLETEPVDLPGQPDFLNLVAEIDTEYFPMQLLGLISRIELAMGRERRVPKGPRVIDIDILLYGKFVVRSPKLEIPHPRMAGRRFVMEPLAELAPELRHPVTKKTMREILGAIKDQRVRRAPEGLGTWPRGAVERVRGPAVSEFPSEP
jgi:2-amino-4-hydroxy-6-hydroxymethyldihydropteridine diphosphokinase